LTIGSKTIKSLSGFAIYGQVKKIRRRVMLTPPKKFVYAIANILFMFGCLLSFILKNNELGLISLVLAYLILFSGNTFKGI